MPTPEATVYVVDDDEAVRRYLHGLISSVDLGVVACASAREFLENYRPGSPGCILLDIRMPGMSGLELQAKLSSSKIDLPLIILTGHGNVQIAVRSMKTGAFDFIEKPFNNELLLDRIQKAVAESVRSGRERLQRSEIVRRSRLLTPRERQVMEMVVAGQTSKSIARQLKISDKTVEFHRANLMDKMKACSLAMLIRMVSALHDAKGKP